MCIGDKRSLVYVFVEEDLATRSPFHYFSKKSLIEGHQNKRGINQRVVEMNLKLYQNLSFKYYLKKDSIYIHSGDLYGGCI